jgi:hypothetical protein
MEKILKERIEGASQKDLLQPSAFNELKKILANIIGWNRDILRSKTIENGIHGNGIHLSPLKMHELSHMNSLNQYHRYYGRYTPYNQRT